MKKLAIIITHPIQYYVPVFQQLALNCDLKVFYTWGVQGIGEKYDPDFKQMITWDIPLLEGYNYELLANSSKDPGSHHFRGIKNPSIIEKITDFNPDVILIYGWAYQSHLKAIRYFKGKIPIWFRGDSTLLDEQKGLKNQLRKLFLTWVYQHIDKAFYVGTANKEYFAKFGLKANKLVFAPHAVDNKFFNIEKTEQALNLRTSLGLNSDSILILFAGKLEEKKNPLLLLRAFKDMNQPNLHLLFVGNGALEQELKTESQSFKAVSNNIHFMNFQNQKIMPIVYQSCNLFCLPSKGPAETWGLVINEAMASGKAILVSDTVGSAKDLVGHENGYIFKNNNVEDLKSKLTLLSNNKSLLLQMGLNSRELIKKWTIEAQTSAILKELNS